MTVPRPIPPCGHEHRAPTAALRCAYPHAIWIHGQGTYAVLAHCRSLTITLHRTPEAAQSAKALIDSHGCGGMCHKDHEIVAAAGFRETT